MIKNLDQKTSELIKSQQYIQNTYTIVKELIENSLDSNATEIKIFVDDELIRVEDNGTGILDLKDVGNEGYTSKELTTYFVLGLNTDSTNIYCGYRGLALCSIKNMCSLEITSRHKNNLIGYKKNINTGHISVCPREIGTTVDVTNIFNNCILRKKLNKKSLTKDVKQIIKLVEAYVKVYDVHFQVKFKGTTIFNECGYKNILEYCKSKFNNIYDECLIKDMPDFFIFMFPNNQDKEESTVYFGKRFVTSKKISKEIKSTYNLFQEGLPLFYLVLKCPIDFNISPTKSEILFENEDEIIGKIKKEITNFLSNQMVFKNNHTTNKKISENGRLIKVENKQDVSNFRPQEKIINVVSLQDTNDSTQEMLDNYIAEEINKSLENETEALLEEEYISDTNLVSQPNNSLMVQENKAVVVDLVDNKIMDVKQNVLSSPFSDINCKSSYVNSPTTKKFKSSLSYENKEFEVKETEVKPIYEVPVSPSNENFNIESSGKTICLQETAYDFIKQVQQCEISLVLKKNDFFDMEIIGQFNKGFIITRLVKNDKAYLIIVDQHAADEIFNYENIKKNAKILKQKVLVPIELKLSPIDKLFVEENIVSFSIYGFDIENMKLLTVPVFKGEEFNLNDFYELLDNFKNGGEGLTKIQKIMASKACRMSVMVGDSLNKAKLEKIVKRLKDLEKPWKCPHGRPTFMVVEEIDLV